MASRMEVAGTDGMPSDTQNGAPNDTQDGTQSQRRTMSYISLFSGIEAASVAWQPLGWKPLCFSEIDEFPSAVLAARYPDVPNLGDIKNVDWQDAMEKYGKPDVVIGGSPCFPAGALVMTEHGFKPIEDIVPGDMVMTHKGRMRRVLYTGMHYDDTIILKGKGSSGIECTASHPFLATTKHTIYYKDGRYANGKYKYIQRSMPTYQYSWEQAQNMLGKYWLNVIPAQEMIDKCRIPALPFYDNNNISDEMFYFIGRWLGDGWGEEFTYNGHVSYRVHICCAHSEGDMLESRIQSAKLHYTRVETAKLATTRFDIYSKTLLYWLKDNFGIGAMNKNIPAWCVAMPTHSIHALLNGYFDADGYHGSQLTSCSVSHKLVLGIKMLMGRVGYTSSTSYVIPKESHLIKGQKCHEHPYWNQSYSHKSYIGFFDENQSGWFGLVRTIQEGRKHIPVYNLEVEEDHSYTVDGIAVHNCQSFSVAGKREGLSGASGLMYEYIRAIQEIRPRNVIFENVPGAFSSEHGQAFRQLLSSLDDLGYGLAWRVLDSEFWGVAQRRRRVFLIGCLGDPERAAKVLFDDPSLYRDPKPGRVKRQEIAGRAGDRAQGADTEMDDTNAEQPPDVVALQPDGSTSLRGNEAGWNDADAAYALNAIDRQSVAYRMIAINQRNEARYDGGDGQTVGAIPAQPGGKQLQCVIEAHGSGTDPSVIGEPCASDAKQIGNQYVNQGEMPIETRHADGTTGDTPPDGTQTRRDAYRRQGVTATQDAPQGGLQGMETTPSKQGTGNTQRGTTSMAARAAERAVIMASGQSHAERLVGMSPTLAARQYKDPPILFMPDTGTASNDEDGMQDASKGVTYVVRRLMPIETERLQGFPDNWTDLTGEDADRIAGVLLDGPFAAYDERHATALRRNVRRWCAACPDGKRYKATGNSMAVPVIRWLGERIAETERE